MAGLPRQQVHLGSPAIYLVPTPARRTDTMSQFNTPYATPKQPLRWRTSLVSWRAGRVLRLGASLLFVLQAQVGAQSEPAAVLSDSTVVEYDLRVAAEKFAPAGKRIKALTINGGIPGPTLFFTEGGTARITVHNTLADQETSIHWHGLLVPNEMDGVPYLTTPPIPAGGSRLFEFPIRQSGTYWYHSHTGLQEQRGVYGSIVIQPRSPDVEVDREHVVVLSDWTNEHPQEVMRTLMRGSEWYGTA